jgi:primosomal replication protein N
MSIGTKNRLNLIGTTCKAHLREQFSGEGVLVEEFIAEFEGTGKNADLNAWAKFTDAKRDNTEMLRRVDAAFETWMNP